MRADKLQSSGGAAKHQTKTSISEKKEEISFFRQKITDLQNAYDQLF